LTIAALAVVMLRSGYITSGSMAVAAIGIASVSHQVAIHTVMPRQALPACENGTSCPFVPV
jgi:hypothetical protein